MRNEIQENFAKKNKDSELRHKKNVIEVKKENKKLEQETENREFQKYITYYFLKKGQNQSLSKKKKEQNNKLQEKADKLEEIEKQNEERRNQLAKKMNKMDKKRAEYIKLKEDKIIEDKMRRNEKEKNVRNRLDEMNKEEYERRRDILDYQIDIVVRNINSTSNKNLRKTNSGQNSISNQIALQNHVTVFNKKLNVLKSQSVTKKPLEEKIRIYKDMKRKEAERKKREKEDELFNKGQ
jgi:hypothetical protein